MLDQTRINYRGEYGLASGGAVRDHVLMAVATEYENTVMRKISALAPDDIGQRFGGSDTLLVQRKYDGEGALIYFDAEHCFSFSAPAGRVRVGYPALQVPLWVSRFTPIANHFYLDRLIKGRHNSCSDRGYHLG